MIAAALWSCSPSNVAPAGPAASVVWKDETAFVEAGRAVHVVDGATTVAPILIGRYPDLQTDPRSWRLPSDAPSGRLEGLAVGVIPKYVAQFHPDLDGDGALEVRLGWLNLVSADEVGLVDASMGWIQTEISLATAPSGDMPCGDLTGDGRPELCLVAEDARDRVLVWSGPLDPSTFDARAPDAVYPTQSGASVTRMFGVTEASGGRRLVVSTNLTDELEVHDLVNGTVVVTPRDGSTVAVGELDGLPGDEVVAESYTSLDLYTIGASGGLEPTGAGLASTGAAVVVGDFDGDGANDLAVSESMQYERGWVRIYRGPFDSGYRPPADADLRLTTSSEGFGAAMSAADVDGDGRDDLVVGAPGDDTLGEDAGAAYLWLGADLFP